MTTTAAPPYGRRTRAPKPYRLDVHLGAAGALDSLAADVRRGLSGTPRWLLPKYLYDATGSDLYERITELPECYQARTELGILQREIPGIIDRLAPTELVELGSGSSRKTRVILDAMDAAGTLRRYLPIDVCPPALLDAAGMLAEAYPGLRVHAIAGDFERHLGRVPVRPPSGRRLVVFLGGTIGNLGPEAREPFMRHLAGLLRPGDALLMGTDLVNGDPERIRRAYDDDAGVTAEFNRNILRVINRELAADFDPEAWDHRAVWRTLLQRVEMRLRAREPMRVHIGALGMEVAFEEGEELVTELCCKFTRPSAEEMYRAAGLDLVEWHTDERRHFAVSVAVRREE